LIEVNRGEKMNLLTKLTKNSRVRNTMVPRTELKGRGVGHVLAMAKEYHAASVRRAVDRYLATYRCLAY